MRFREFELTFRVTENDGSSGASLIDMGDDKSAAAEETKDGKRAAPVKKSNVY